jgi:hypothetical protein
MSNFKDWNRDKLRARFGLKRNYHLPAMEAWSSSTEEISNLEQQILSLWQQSIQKYVDFWNEEEVKLKFIGNLISLTNYDTENLSAFADRYLEGEVDGEVICGKPDFMVAQGKQDVGSPFFFIHEYKKEAPYPPQGEIIEDPAAQLLAAMLVAYEHNLNISALNQKPIYGAYVIGRLWYFVVLQGREYAMSLAYDATKADDLLEIFRMLKANRQQIREIWGE